MFDGAVARDYACYMERLARADPRRNGHGPKRVVLAASYSRYDGGILVAICPACENPATVAIYPCELVEAVQYVASRTWTCVTCQREQEAVFFAQDVADGYGPPERADFEDDVPF